MNRDHTKSLLVILAVSVSTVLAALPTKAQTGVRSPLANTVLAGYGSTTFSAINNDKFVSNFTASVSPVILYSMGSDFLFETELEFGLSGQVTTTSLEYAQIDYLGFERVVVIAGKFLLPFGVFSERLHPTWINKMPNAPVLYGHAHGGVAEGSLMPVLSDAGVLVRYNLPMNNEWTLDLSGWVSQGPVLVSHDDEGDGHDDEGDGHDDEHAGKTGASVETNSVAEIEIPQIGFGIAFDDYFAREGEVLAELERDGLVTLGADRVIRLAFPLGRVLMRNVAAVFDVYLNPDAYRRGQEACFSANA